MSAGCASAVVTIERVLRRDEREARRGRCCRASCVCVAVAVADAVSVDLEDVVDMGRACEVHRVSAGQSHGSVSWSASVEGTRDVSLRSFRPAARASILEGGEEEKKESIGYH